MFSEGNHISGGVLKMEPFSLVWERVSAIRDGAETTTRFRRLELCSIITPRENLPIPFLHPTLVFF